MSINRTITYVIYFFVSHLINKLLQVWQSKLLRRHFLLFVGDKSLEKFCCWNLSGFYLESRYYWLWQKQHNKRVNRNKLTCFLVNNDHCVEVNSEDGGLKSNLLVLINVIGSSKPQSTNPQDLSGKHTQTVGTCIVLTVAMIFSLSDRKALNPSPNTAPAVL